MTEHKLRDDFVVGKKVNTAKFLADILVIVFLSCLFTGFGYQPLGVFIIVLSVGLFLTLPACFDSYWTICLDRINIYEYDKNVFVKFVQLLGLRKQKVVVLKYAEMTSATLEYRKKSRVSPFDITSDYFEINCLLKNGQRMSLNISRELVPELFEFVNLLRDYGVEVFDPDQTLQVIKSGKNLFEYYHK